MFPFLFLFLLFFILPFPPRCRPVLNQRSLFHYFIVLTAVLQSFFPTVLTVSFSPLLYTVPKRKEINGKELECI